jgi:Domain of unknown function (DUF4129)
VISPDRGEGQRWAREELAHPEYARARPTLFQRAVSWLLDRIDDLAANTGLGTGQLIALVVTVAVVVVVALVLLRRTVRLRVAAEARATGDVLAGSTETGAQHRARAAAAVAAGQYDVAVRESMRALARRLDERALLDPRPGRTADEIAVEAARLLPELATELREGARTFDDVAYGSVRADAARADRMRRLDERVEAAKPVVLAGFPLS